MAINACEIDILERVLKAIGSSKPRVLFLGYPDALVDEATWPLQSVSFRDAAKRKDADEIWKQHNRPQMIGRPMVETKGLFERLGAQVSISDAISWGGETILLDLNHVAPRSYRRRFDLIVDPGTLEHCFNIAQAFDNIDRMLKPGGFAYHQAAMAFPNHGMWSISPTAFYDFYEARGFELGRAFHTVGTEDENGFKPKIAPIDPFVPLPQHTGPAIAYYVFRKNTARRTFHWRRRYPTQRCYSSLSREPKLIEFF